MKVTVGIKKRYEDRWNTDLTLDNASEVDSNQFTPIDLEIEGNRYTADGEELMRALRALGVKG